MSSSPSLVKILLLLASSALYQRATTSPHAPQKGEETKFSGHEMQHMTKLISGYGPLVTQAVTWAASICESAIILAHAFPNHPLSATIMKTLTSLLGHSIATERIGFTPAFLTGSALLATGTLIRIFCYRYLGKFFTFQLAVRQDHQLVTTGPYSVVRHPAYTGLLMAFTGVAMVNFGSGSYLTEIMDVWKSAGGKAFVAAMLGIWGVAGVGIVLRTRNEDIVLRKEFGPQWEQWHKQTPYRLIPGIY